MDNEAKCPFTSKAHSGTSNRDWWPNQLSLKVLHRNPPAGDPMGAEFNYAEESPRTRPRAIPWARSSTTPRSSRPSISRP